MIKLFDGLSERTKTETYYGRTDIAKETTTYDEDSKTITTKRTYQYYNEVVIVFSLYDVYKIYYEKYEKSGLYTCILFNKYGKEETIMIDNIDGLERVRYDWTNLYNINKNLGM